MEKLEKLAGILGGIFTAGALMFASPNYADAKVTQITKRPNGTITRIYDDAVRERVENNDESKAGAYLYPVRFCDKCETYHADENRRKVELQFQTKSGRTVDYLHQTKRPQSEIYPQPTEQEVKDFDDKARNERISKAIKDLEKELGTSQKK